MKRPEPPAAAPVRNAAPDPLPWVLVVLAACVTTLPELGLPFLGDDYVFLDETRGMGFAGLWSRANVRFGWYRPWSRELWFWTLQHAAGPNAAVFRAANVALWIGALLLLGRALRRIADARIAASTVIFVAGLGLWSAPLVWISGSQDLWLVFLLAVVLVLDRGPRRAWALLPFAAALLSKETAAVFPLVLAGFWVFVDRCRPGEFARRTAPYAAVTLLWLAWHPIVLARLANPRMPMLAAEAPLPAWEVVVRSVQSLANADQLGGTLNPDLRRLAWLALGSLLLVAAEWRVGRRAAAPMASAQARGVISAGAAWAAAGWLPLFLPSVGWHAYYGCVGAIGAWLALVTWLRADRLMTVGLLAVLGLLRLGNASTESLDWGSEWYQRRAADLMSRVHARLLVLHPSLPPHARLYFGGIPNNIGLIAGDSPALRVWYADSTIGGGFYSYYRPRRADEPPGPDLFFRYDPARGLHEVRLGPEDAAAATARDPSWAQDHESLASLLWHAGDVRRAADEYEKVGGLPARGDALLAAAACRDWAGDAPAAAALAARAAERLRLVPGAVADSIAARRARIAQVLR